MTTSQNIVEDQFVLLPTNEDLSSESKLTQEDDETQNLLSQTNENEPSQRSKRNKQINDDGDNEEVERDPTCCDLCDNVYTAIFTDVTPYLLSISPMTSGVSLCATALHGLCLYWIGCHFSLTNTEPVLFCLNELSVQLRYLPLCVAHIFMFRVVTAFVLRWRLRLRAKMLLEAFVRLHGMPGFILLILITIWVAVLIYAFGWGGSMTIHVGVSLEPHVVCDCHYNPPHPMEVYTVTYNNPHFSGGNMLTDIYNVSQQLPSCIIKSSDQLDKDCYFSRLIEYLYRYGAPRWGHFANICVNDGTAFCHEQCAEYIDHLQGLRRRILGSGIAGIWVLYVGVPMFHQLVRPAEIKFWNRWFRCGFVDYDNSKKTIELYKSDVYIVEEHTTTKKKNDPSKEPPKETTEV